ncbi:MAG: hypothetical protein ABIF08_01200 [Nanoarchaeota archaeon]
MKYPILGDVIEEVCPMCHILGISDEPQDLRYIGELGNGVKHDYFECDYGHKSTYTDLGFVRMDIKRQQGPEPVYIKQLIA